MNEDYNKLLNIAYDQINCYRKIKKGTDILAIGVYKIEELKASPEHTDDIQKLIDNGIAEYQTYASHFKDGRPDFIKVGLTTKGAKDIKAKFNCTEKN